MHEQTTRPAPNGYDTPGTMLRSAREAAGLSVDSVAGRLRLLRSAVRYLEEDSYDRLRGDTFVRGYMRNYARLLGIAEEPVVARFEEIRRAERAIALSREQRQLRRRQSPGRIGSLALMLGLGALPVFGKRDAVTPTAYADAGSTTMDAQRGDQDPR